MTENATTTEPVSVSEKVKELAEAAGDLDSIGYVRDLGGIMRIFNPDLHIPVISDIRIWQLVLLSLVLFFASMSLFDLFPCISDSTATFFALFSLLLVMVSLFALPFIAHIQSHSKETFEAREKYSTQAIKEIHKSILDNNDYDTENLQPQVDDFSWELKNSIGVVSKYPTEAVLHWVNKDSGDIIFTTSHQKNTPEKSIESIEVIHGAKDVARVGQ